MVIAVVLTVNFVAPAETWTSPAAALPQFAGEDVEEQEDFVPNVPAINDGITINAED